jgi:hypothetical protein
MRIIYTILFFLIISISFGQLKNTSIGLRGGGISGLSVKMIDFDNQGVELLVGWQRGGARLTGIYQKYIPRFTDRINGFYVFSGIGGHAGYVRIYDNRYYDQDDPYYYRNKYKAYSRVFPIIGMDVMLGAEYQFESVPITISLDYKPYFEFFGGRTFRLDLWDIGFTIRYVINKN